MILSPWMDDKQRRKVGMERDIYMIKNVDEVIYYELADACAFLLTWYQSFIDAISCAIS